MSNAHDCNIFNSSGTERNRTPSQPATSQSIFKSFACNFCAEGNDEDLDLDLM